jgi:hypothetical protein
MLPQVSERWLKHSNVNMKQKIFTCEFRNQLMATRVSYLLRGQRVRKMYLTLNGGIHD